jgi:hypothetical protein
LGSGTLTVTGNAVINGSISDSGGNLVLDDTVDIGSATTGLRVATNGAISDIDSTSVTISDSLIVNGSAGTNVAAFNPNAGSNIAPLTIGSNGVVNQGILGFGGEESSILATNFLTNELTNWVNRGGTITPSTTGGASIVNANNTVYASGDANLYSTVTTVAGGNAVYELTGLSVDVPGHAVWAPYVRLRAGTYPTAIQIEYRRSDGVTWDVIVNDTTPAISGGIWVGNNTVYVSYPITGVRFTLTYGASATSYVRELGLYNKNTQFGKYNFAGLGSSSNVFRGIANSANAFTVQNTSGANVFNVNTTTPGISTSGTLTVTGLTTLNGGLTVEAGDTFTMNGDAFTDLTGSGLTLVSGALTVDATSATGFFRNGGNSFGAAAILGTNDANTLSFETGGTTRFTLDAAASTLTGQGATTLSSTGTLTVSSAAASNISVTTGTTGSLSLDTGSTGAINIGTNANAKTITLGNSTGATQLVLNTGTGGVNLGSNGIANTIQIGNTTGAVAQTISIGTNATASSTNNVTIGSTVAGTVALQGTTTITNRTTGSANTLTINNSTSTGNILNLQDNGTNVVTVADGGVTTLTANGGTNIALTVNNGTSTGNILRLQDNGTNVLTVADGGNLAVDTDTLFVDATNNRVGIGTTTVTQGVLNVSGTVPTGVVSGGIYVNSTLSSTTFGQSGVRSVPVIAPASASTQAYYGFVASATSSSANVAGAIIGGMYGGGYYGGTGTIGTMYGVYGANELDTATGSATTSVSFYAADVFTAGGTVTNNYGLYVETINGGANDYGIYVQNADTYALWVDGGATRLDGTLEVQGNTDLQGNLTVGNATTDRLTVTSQILGGSPLVFQGATDNGFTTTLAVTDPTANRTITLPDATGTVLLGASTSGFGIVQVPNSNTAGTAGANIISPTDASIVGLTVNGTTGTAATALSVAQTGTATAATISQSQNNDGLTVTANALTTANGLTVSSTGTGLTSGSIIRATTATTGAIATNGAVSFQATGNYTSTANIGLLSVLANSTTAGTIQNIQGNALTTGQALYLSSTGTGMTTGSLLFGTTATTGAVATNGIFSLNASGNYTSTANAGLLDVKANSTTAGTIARIQGNALTTGQALYVSSTGTGLTSGSLGFFTSATTGAVATNGIFSLNATGNYTSTANAALLDVKANATTAGTVANIQGNALTTGVGLRVASTGTGLTTGSLLQVTSATTGAVATNGVVNLVASGNYTSTANVGLLSVQANSTTAGTIANINGNALTTGQALYLASTSTGMTTGSLLFGTTATTGAVATNGIFSLNATGNYTSTSNAGLLNVVANATNAGTITNIQGNALTTGTALNISSTGVLATTGNLLTLTANSATTATGVVAINATGLTTGVALNVTSNSTATAIQSNGNITFGELTGTRTLGVQTRTSGLAGTNLTVQAGAGGTGAGFAGGALTLQGGSAGGTNANGGNVVLVGGVGVGTGVKGLVVVDTATFNAATVQNFTANANITQSNIDTFGSVLISGNVAGWVATLTDPTITTAGRVIYVTNSGTVDISLAANSGLLDITLKPGSTATMFWNGADWTAAGASSSTDLQAAYDNTATSAGGAELILNASGGAADGLTIRNNPTTPINGGIFEVQTSIGTNLFSVNNLGTELAANGGAETSGTFSTNWTAAPAGGTITRTTTSGQYVTGQAGVQIVTTATANHGVRNNLSANPVVSTTYTVSFTARLSAGTFSTLQVQYSRDGGTDLEACTNYSTQTLSTSVWTKVTCTITTDGTAATNPDLIIRQTDTTARTFWIDNLSFVRNDSTTQPSNVQIGGGINGGQVTLFTLDRSSGPPVTDGDTTYYGSMYYDTVTGRIQCYESDGWGACGSAPDNIITLTPEYPNAVLNGTGVGTMTADFCANQSGVLVVGTLCASGISRNFYRWTSPQATSQTYSIYVSFKLPNTFKAFQSANTMRLTALTTDTTDASVTYEVFRSTGSAITSCNGGAATTVTTANNTWQTVNYAGDETACGFVGGNQIIYKINVIARNNDSVYVENLDFTFLNQ